MEVGPRHLASLSTRLGNSHGSGEQLQFCCPFVDGHGGWPDRKYHLYLSRTSGLWICYKCGAKGNLRSLLRSLGLPDPEPEEIAAPTTEAFVAELASLFVAPPPPSLAYPCRTEPVLPGFPAWDYLRGRKISPEAIVEHRMEWGEWRGAERVFIPTTEAGRVVFWVARAFSSADSWAPRYVNPPVPKGGSLFNFERASRYPEVIITEGVFSALAAGPSAVSLFGKIPTPEQLTRITTTWKRFVVALDGDARTEALGLAATLACQGSVSVVDFELDQDPASAADLQARLRGATPGDIGSVLAGLLAPPRRAS